MDFPVFDLGLSSFKEAWDFQREIFSQVKNGYLDSALVVCQHYPVITLGRSADKKNILVSPEELAKQNIAIYEVERGGDVTYHGPQQLMAYPICNLIHFKKDISAFLRYLEKAVVSLLADLGIQAKTYSGSTGVWLNQRQKIASIGIAIKNWVTFHGLSLNVKKGDSDNLRFIRPCGMDIEMVSLETILGRAIEINQVKEGLVAKLKAHFPVGTITRLTY